MDSVHLLHGDNLRRLEDERFYDLHSKFRLAFGHRMVCYYHLLALHDLGRLVHVPAEGERALDMRAVFDNVRLLCFLLFHVMSALQKEIRRRAAARKEGADIYPDETLYNPEMRWMFVDYARWCMNFTRAYMMKPDLILCVVQNVEKWCHADVEYMSVMREQLLVLKRVLELDVDVVLHIARPVDMPKNQYPTMDLLAYYESRFRGLSGVEYSGVILHGGYGAFPQFERANSF